jgi:flagellar protein FlgJ
MEIPVIKNSGRNYLNIDRDKQLKQACEDFEAYFYEMVFKSARKTIQDGGLIKKSFGEEVFTEMWDARMAQEVAHRSQNSLKDMLYNQLKGVKGYENKDPGKNILHTLA